MLIAVLPGDGIGPEVTHAAVEVCQAAVGSAEIEWTEAPFGHNACLEQGTPFSDETRALCLSADAVLLGAVGGSEELPPDSPRPEAGLLALRAALGLLGDRQCDESRCPAV